MPDFSSLFEEKKKRFRRQLFIWPRIPKRHFRHILLYCLRKATKKKEKKNAVQACKKLFNVYGEKPFKTTTVVSELFC